MAVLTNHDPNFGIDNSGDSPYLLESLDGSTATAQGAAHVTLQNATLGDVWELYGSFTAFNDAGQPIAGVVGELDNTFTLSNIHVDVAEFFAPATQANMQKLLADAFAGDDWIAADSAPAPNFLMGYDGNDTIDASTAPQNNTLWGGAGDDLIRGGTGVNQVNGNKGQDTIVGRSAAGDQLFGGQGDDSIDASASTGHNYLNGNLGNDTLHGGAGGDTLRGGQGNDLIVGGASADWLSGDMGRDTLTGGAGGDTFHVASNNTLTVVTDFNYGEGDRVLLDSGSGYTVSASGADTTINLAGGGQVILQGVDASTLPAGAILLG